MHTHTPWNDLWSRVEAALSRERAAAVEFRHDLHRHPELSRQERRTTSRLAEALGDLPVRVRRGKDGLGLIVDAGPDAPTRVCLRADIDALALDEESGVAFASEHAGVMHACGHDVHTSVVLAATRALVMGAPEVPLRFLFQPAEEATPGGSLDLIAAGAVEGVSHILTVHCDPTRALGNVGLQAGALTAAADVFEVTLRGNGGHGARPHETQDLVLVGCEAVQALYHGLDRGVDARKPLAISVGVFHAGRSSANVIPAEVFFSGTIRTTDRSVRDAVPAILERVLGGIAAIWQVKYELVLTRGAPAVVNDPAIVEALRLASGDVVGAENITPTGLPSMGGEDFAWYLDHVPGALLRLGTGVGAPLHSTRFAADDAAIDVGARILANAALRLSRTGNASP
jgi:amidohydrolase